MQDGRTRPCELWSSPTQSQTSDQSSPTASCRVAERRPLLPAGLDADVQEELRNLLLPVALGLGG
eukprot:11280531-Alexandrium_andersonii.AAC.1